LIAYFIGNILAKKCQNAFTYVKVIANQRWDVIGDTVYIGPMPLAMSSILGSSNDWRCGPTMYSYRYSSFPFHLPVCCGSSLPALLLDLMRMLSSVHTTRVYGPWTRVVCNVHRALHGPLLEFPSNLPQTRMWANAKRDGRPADHRWRSLFNAAKFG